MRSLDFTVCVRKNCANSSCWRKLTTEEQEWLENNPNRQAYASFDECEDFEEDKNAI